MHNSIFETNSEYGIYVSNLIFKNIPHFIPMLEHFDNNLATIPLMFYKITSM